MNVDWLDDETIFYLDEDDLKNLLNGKNIWKVKEEQKPVPGSGVEDIERTFSVHLHTSQNSTPGRYDDCLLALEEAVTFINAAQELGIIDGIDGRFDLGKVIRTYEYHKQIQQEYE